MGEDGGRRRAPAEKDETKKPTRRVVLKREQVLVLPEDLSQEDLDKLMGTIKASKIKVGITHEAWLVIGEFEGSTKDKAIEAFAGKAGTPDAKVGAFKAPGAAAWAGGALYKAPPKPLVEKEAIE